MDRSVVPREGDGVHSILRTQMSLQPVDPSQVRSESVLDNKVFSKPHHVRCLEADIFFSGYEFSLRNGPFPFLCVLIKREVQSICRICEDWFWRGSPFAFFIDLQTFLDYFPVNQNRFESSMYSKLNEYKYQIMNRVDFSYKG